MLALPMRSSGERRKPFLRVRELKRPEGSGMLINDHLGEGSNTSSTNKESDRSQSSREQRNSDTQNERELRRSEGSGMLINNPLGKGSNASSTNSELWRAENSFLR